MIESVISRKTLIPLGMVITICSVLWASGKKVALFEGKLDEHDKALVVQDSRIDRIEADRAIKIVETQRTLAEIKTNVSWLVEMEKMDLKRRGYK